MGFRVYRVQGCFWVYGLRLLLGLGFIGLKVSFACWFTIWG